MKKTINTGLQGRNLVRRSRFSGYKGMERINREATRNINDLKSESMSYTFDDKYISDTYAKYGSAGIINIFKAFSSYDLPKLYKTNSANDLKNFAEIIANDSQTKWVSNEITNHLVSNSPKQQLLALRPKLLQIASKNDDVELDLFKKETFIEVIQKRFLSGEKFDNRVVNKIAEGFQLKDPRVIKEQTEFALVEAYRLLAHSGKTRRETFDEIVIYYKNQVNLTLRTSTSVMFQQYSTPAPIAYLMGVWCGVDKYKPIGQFKKICLEPSAGNGLLTIAGNHENFFVNELDDLRYSNLARFKAKDEKYPNSNTYHAVMNLDASTTKFIAQVNAKVNEIGFGMIRSIITNPPFGSLSKEEYQTFDGYTIKDLDHLMAIRALSLMPDGGKAAIIIGGHTKYDELGRIQAGKNRVFLNFLYSHYEVQDVININGDLYSRMGTSFDIRLILIHGRKEKIGGFAPLASSKSKTTVNTFNELYERIFSDEK